jgi:type III secretion system YscQ/HrcQ family protein
VISAFPWTSLDPLTKGEIEASKAVRETLEGLDLDLLRRTLEDMAQQPLEIRPRKTRFQRAPRGASADVGVLLVDAGDGLDRACLLECEAPLAVALVAGALRQPAPTVVDPAKVPTARIAGALGAVVLAAARKARGEAVRVLAAGPSHALYNDLLRSRGELATTQVTVLLGHQAYAAAFSTGVSGPASKSREASWALEDLGILPLRFQVTAAFTTLAQSDLATLEVGDVLLPEGLGYDPQRGVFTGALWLGAERGEHGLAVDVDDQGRWIYRGQELRSWTAEAEAEPSNEEQAEAGDGEKSMKEVAEDVPVVARVEIGSVEMSAAAWAGLRPGDAITTGRRVGSTVSLRVSGVEVARGELVQIDGEIGVRILEKLQSGS